MLPHPESAMPPTFAPIHTERLLLRRFEARDVEPFHAYRADPDVARFQGWSLDYSREDAEAFVAEQSAVEIGSPGVGAQIAIESKATGTLIGDLFLFVWERNPQDAKFGYSIARASWGKGYATEAVLGLLGYLFDTCGMHRLTAITDTQNERSVALLERIGMRREAHHLESWHHRDRWTDEYVYALLQREWRAR